MRILGIGYNNNQSNYNNAITGFERVLTKNCCSQPPRSENVTCDALGSTLISVLYSDPNDEYDFRGFFSWKRRKLINYQAVEK